MLTRNTRTVKCEDQRFAADESNTQFENHVFIRLSAKQRTFTRVSFKYCVFDGCYFRACRFLGCDFTGCRFLSTNFHGTSFASCQFAYATFEKTAISDDILDTQAPDFENQKERFARSLRINYQQLGEAVSANKAIRIELEATKTHLYEAWHSKKDYYRNKYPGWKRIRSFFRWFWFTVLDFLWGNGESALRLLRSLVLLFLGMGIYDAFHTEDPGQIKSYWIGFSRAPEVFLGARTPPQYPYWYLTGVGTIRLLAFAALAAILIKRFNRR